MTFYLNPDSQETGINQYKRYLENTTYIRDLKRQTDDAINYQLVEIRRGINSASVSSQSSITNLTKSVCGTLENGFSEIAKSLTAMNDNLSNINYTLENIDQGIYNLHILLDWKTDCIIEQSKISNMYLGKIVKLLKIPDSQKQRGYHVEQGLTFLKTAIEEGPSSVMSIMD